MQKKRYGIVTRDGRLIWYVQYGSIGGAKLAVRNNHFNEYLVGVAEIENWKVVGAIHALNNENKWEVINNG